MREPFDSRIHVGNDGLRRLLFCSGFLWCGLLRRRFLCLFLFHGCFVRIEGCKLFHQAALAPRRVIGVQHASLRGPIQDADGFHDCLFGIRSICGRSSARLSNRCAGGASKNSIANAALFVLPIPFDLRFDVCQDLPPKLTFLILMTALYFT